jgi:hypothetical protein
MPSLFKFLAYSRTILDNLTPPWWLFPPTGGRYKAPTSNPILHGPPSYLRNPLTLAQPAIGRQQCEQQQCFLIVHGMPWYKCILFHPSSSLYQEQRTYIETRCGGRVDIWSNACVNSADLSCEGNLEQRSKTVGNRRKELAKVELFVLSTLVNISIKTFSTMQITFKYLTSSKKSALNVSHPQLTSSSAAIGAPISLLRTPRN